MEQGRGGWNREEIGWGGGWIGSSKRMGSTVANPLPMSDLL